MSLGKRIKEARLKKGLTQRQLADLIGVKHNSISDWENDKNMPYADTIELLLGALEVDANWLLGWDNPKQMESDAQELVNKILNNYKVQKALPLIANLNDSDLDLVLNFIKRLGGNDNGS
jgi:transcriptional regulator with XRE-family HTH domain